MIRISLLIITGLLLGITSAQAQEPKKEPDKAAPKKIPPQLEELLKLTPEQFIKRFDKDGDGKLSMDELPPFFAKAFAASDKDGDGKLNREEVAAMLMLVRQFFAAGAPPPGPMDLDKIVDNILKQFGADKDGKISRQQAKGKLLEIFDQLDLNKDGFLDRKELRVLAQRMQGGGGKGGPPPMSEPDFDALDKNADGRLTRAELKGTPWFDRFDEIDTDRNGQIDRREFEASLRRESEKKTAAEKK